jgi:hypothetical protein
MKKRKKKSIPNLISDLILKIFSLVSNVLLMGGVGAIVGIILDAAYGLENLVWPATIIGAIIGVILFIRRIYVGIPGGY